MGKPTVFAISMQKIDPSVGNSMIKMLKQMKKDAIDEVFAEFKTKFFALARNKQALTQGVRDVPKE